MRQIALTCFLVITAALRVAAQTPATAQRDFDKPSVKVGMFSVTGGAYEDASTDGERIEPTHVWMTACDGIGAAKRDLPLRALATDVWSFEGALQTITPEAATVQMRWQRVRKAGEAVAEPAHAEIWTLKFGERVTIEKVEVPQRGDCPARTAAFEVRFEQWVPPPPVRVADSPGSGRRPQIAMVREGDRTVSGMVAADGTLPNVFDADMWLVRTRPGQGDEVVQTKTLAGHWVSDFAFPPVVIETSAGTVGVRIVGTIELGRTGVGARQFVFAATRRVAFSPASRPVRESDTRTEGIARAAGPLPGPEEVLSYEMPPLQVSGGPAVPDRFSIRVRLTPRKVAPAQ